MLIVWATMKPSVDGRHDSVEEAGRLQDLEGYERHQADVMAGQGNRTRRRRKYVEVAQRK